MKPDEYRSLLKQSPLEREMEAQLVRAGISFEKQFRFAPLRKWKADFLLSHYKVLVECDGAVWSKGKTGHNSGTGIASGYERCNEAQILGFTMLRFEGKAIKDGTALATILRACQIGEHKAWRGSR